MTAFEKRGRHLFQNDGFDGAQEDVGMTIWRKTYTTYSIGFAVGWGVVLTVVASEAGKDTGAASFCSSLEG